MLKKIQTIFQQEGFSAIGQRAWDKILRESGNYYKEVVARGKGSYKLRTNSNSIKLTPRLSRATIHALFVKQCISQQVAQHYLEHRFDLLGSGWVQVRYGMQCRGMADYCYDMSEVVVPDIQGQWLNGRINLSNLANAQRIWQHVDHDYQPIDWQLDFKSGYRWSEKVWASRLSYGYLLGVDVKVPWELSRMQHLPQMALRAAALDINNVESQRLVRDIRNQWLDFIATNPPGFGVNWLCPMDIAIRSANWCLTWDILQAAGFALDAEDETVLAHSLYDHGHYVVAHLEWSTDRANHYLANICGLIFVAVYLPENRETNQWLAFAIGQVQTETLHQFLLDGGNFEGSTAYHRLSAEMVLYATALILGLPQARLDQLVAVNPKTNAYLPGSAATSARWNRHETGINADGESIRTPFAPQFVKRLQRAVSFFATILESDGSFPQIGDNDNGRFFKLKPVYYMMTVGEAKRKYINLDSYDELDKQQLYPMEEHCRGQHLINIASGLGFTTAPTSVITDHEYHLISNLTNGAKLTSQEYNNTSNPKGAQGAMDRLAKHIMTHPDGLIKTFQHPALESHDFLPLNYYNFPDFGLYVWRSKGLMITVRSIEAESIHAKGHFHDDQLSIEVSVNGNRIIRDPGTYVYTALPAERNRYRSRSAHFLSSHREFLNLAVFEPPRLRPVRALYGGVEGFAGTWVSTGSTDYLVLHIQEKVIELFTLTEIQDENLKIKSPKAQNLLPFSPGYGIQELI